MDATENQIVAWRQLIQDGARHLHVADPPDYAAAEELYRQAANLRPDHGETAFWLGITLAQQGKLPEACKVLSTSIKLIPDDSRPLIQLGRCLQQLGRFEQVARYLQKGIDLHPHYGEADARLILAEVYEQACKLDKAAIQWRHILAMESSYPSDDYPMNVEQEKLKKHRLKHK